MRLHEVKPQVYVELLYVIWVSLRSGNADLNRSTIANITDIGQMICMICVIYAHFKI